MKKKVNKREVVVDCGQEMFVPVANWSHLVDPRPTGQSPGTVCTASRGWQKPACCPGTLRRGHLVLGHS